MSDITFGYHGLTVRGDAASCPLAFGLDTYYNCEYDCLYCCFLGLCHTWGRDRRCLDVDWFERRIVNGIKNEHPKSPLAWAIKRRKTLRLGNKFDPLPPLEREHRITQRVLRFLSSLGWQVKLESKNTDAMLEYDDLLISSNAIITTTVTCGMEDDWDVLEGKRPPSPRARLEALRFFASAGCQVAVVTEPFIPGYHTVAQFERLMAELSAHRIRRANVYNLRLTPFVARRLAEAGLDIERIWLHNQDDQWKALLPQLLAAAEKYGILIGCPDFVNAGRFVPTTNTCCGVDVENPCTFNFINWRRIGMERGYVDVGDVTASWDGVGDFDEGLNLFLGNDPKMYHLGDSGVFEREGAGWKLI